MDSVFDLSLLDDDSEDDNFLNRRALNKAGITRQIDEVHDGIEAMDYLVNSGKFADRGTDYPNPDMILLDINMPLMNGWEYLEAYQSLKEDVKAQEVVVMLTTSQSPDDLAKARSLDTVEFFWRNHWTLLKSILWFNVFSYTVSSFWFIIFAPTCHGS